MRYLQSYSAADYNYIGIRDIIYILLLSSRDFENESLYGLGESFTWRFRKKRCIFEMDCQFYVVYNIPIQTWFVRHGQNIDEFFPRDIRMYL